MTRDKNELLPDEIDVWEMSANEHGRHGCWTSPDYKNKQVKGIKYIRADLLTRPSSKQSEALGIIGFVNFMGQDFIVRRENYKSFKALQSALGSEIKMENGSTIELFEDGTGPLKGVEAQPVGDALDRDKKAKWIGSHVINGWIAFDGQLFDPDHYKIVEAEALSCEQPQVDLRSLKKTEVPIDITPKGFEYDAGYNQAVEDCIDHLKSKMEG